MKSDVLFDHVWSAQEQADVVRLRTQLQDHCAVCNGERIVYGPKGVEVCDCVKQTNYGRAIVLTNLPRVYHDAPLVEAPEQSTAFLFGAEFARHEATEHLAGVALALLLSDVDAWPVYWRAKDVLEYRLPAHEKSSWYYDRTSAATALLYDRIDLVPADWRMSVFHEILQNALDDDRRVYLAVMENEPGSAAFLQDLDSRLVVSSMKSKRAGKLSNFSQRAEQFAELG